MSVQYTAAVSITVEVPIACSNQYWPAFRQKSEWNASLCVGVFDLLLPAQCLPTRSYGRAFTPISEAAGFALISAPAHSRTVCFTVDLICEVYPIHDALT